MAALALGLATGAVFWAGADLPPLRLVEAYGLHPGCEPTGRVASLLDVEFVEIGPGCARIGSAMAARPGDTVGRLTRGIGVEWGRPPVPSGEMPVHWTEFPDGFWIGRYEVQNREYERFQPGRDRTGDAPGDADPAVNVQYREAKAYCDWIALNTDVPVRLPSEAEWECACRAGSTGEWPPGVREEDLGRFAWYADNSGGKAHETGTREASAWGLDDFLGNVSEWCADECHPDYVGAPADGAPWGSDAKGSFHEIRGGAWTLGARMCRPARRVTGAPKLIDIRGPALGFRCAFTLAPGREHAVDRFLVSR